MKYNFENTYKRGTRFVSLLLVILMLFSAVSCDLADSADDITDEITGDVAADGSSDDAETTTMPALTIDPDVPVASDTQKPEETETTQEIIDPEDYPVVDPADYDGLWISKVYGHGNAKDAAIKNSFVELYNSTSEPMSLFGLSLYCQGGVSPFAQFPFPKDATIAPGDYYLVVGKDADGYKSEYEVLKIENFDAKWNYAIDNHEINLMIAPVGKNLSKSTNVAEYAGAVDSFIASEGKQDYTFAVDNMSKNKIAVRTALIENSYYHKANLTKLATPEIQSAAPRASGGRINKNVTSRLNEVLFSSPAGFYEKAFNLTLTAREGYDIYYTLDGTDPRDGKASKYSAPFRLYNKNRTPYGPVTKAYARLHGSAVPLENTAFGGTVVRAYATNGTVYTPVYTATYFITKDLNDIGVTIMSMSLGVDEMLNFYHYYDNVDSEGSRPRGTAMMEVFGREGTRVGYSNVEAAVSGHGSSGWGMKSLRLYYKSAKNTTGGTMSDLDYDLFNGRAVDSDGNTITSFSRFMLRNSGNDNTVSYFRDAFMQRAAVGLNVDTMAYEPALLFINGEFWGVYNIRERYSGEYVESHYGVDKDNITIVESDYSQVHTNKLADYVLSSGYEEDVKLFNDLQKFIRTNDMTIEENYKYALSQLDIESFIDMFIVRQYFGAQDFPDNNIKVWRNRVKNDPSGVDNKWHFTLLDLDFGMGLNDGAISNIFYYSMGYNGYCVSGDIMYKLLKNEEFKQLYISRFVEIVTELMPPEYLVEVFDEMTPIYLEMRQYQVGRWGKEGPPGNIGRLSGYGNSVELLQSEISMMRGLIADIDAVAIDRLKSFFKLSDEDLSGNIGKSITVNCSSVRGEVYINGQPAQDGKAVRFDGESNNFKIEVKVKEGYVLSSVTVASGKISTEYTTDSFDISLSNSAVITVSIKKIQDPNEPIAEAEIIAGGSYMFYLTPSGELYAWGDNRGGILGLDPSKNMISTPTFVMDNVKKVVTTSSADYENGSDNWSTAILTKDGKLYTVGKNGSGQLGRNGLADSNTLGLVEFNGTIADIAMGFDHMLVLDSDGMLYGVGSNKYGQLGTGSSGGSVTEFVTVADGVIMMTAGRRDTAFVTEKDNALYVLGDNRWNKYSDTAPNTIKTPLLIMNGVAKISAGEHQLLAITQDGKLYHNGWKSWDTMKAKTDDTPGGFALIDISVKVSDADIYFEDAVILGEDGKAYIYGKNLSGAIGDFAILGREPAQIGETVLSNNVVDVEAGYNFTAYLLDDGNIVVQGNNTFGQAGIGTTGGFVELSFVNFGV